MNTLWIIANCCNNAAELAATPIIKEGTNDCNVLIAAIVCISLVIITLIAAITVSHWHKKELEGKSTGTGKQFEPSQLEKDKREYVAKLLSFMEELSKKDSKMKDASDASCDAYITLLKDLAKKGKIE